MLTSPSKLVKVTQVELTVCVAYVFLDSWSCKGSQCHPLQTVGSHPEMGIVSRAGSMANPLQKSSFQNLVNTTCRVTTSQPLTCWFISCALSG